jgi:hypothetical protein
MTIGSKKYEDSRKNDKKLTKVTKTRNTTHASKATQARDPIYLSLQRESLKIYLCIEREPKYISRERERFRESLYL